MNLGQKRGLTPIILKTGSDPNYSEEKRGLTPIIPIIPPTTEIEHENSESKSKILRY